MSALDSLQKAAGSNLAKQARGLAVTLAWSLPTATVLGGNAPQSTDTVPDLKSKTGEIARVIPDGEMPGEINTDDLTQNLVSNPVKVQKVASMSAERIEKIQSIYNFFDNYSTFFGALDQVEIDADRQISNGDKDKLLQQRVILLKLKENPLLGELGQGFCDDISRLNEIDLNGILLDPDLAKAVKSCREGVIKRFGAASGEIDIKIKKIDEALTSITQAKRFEREAAETVRRAETAIREAREVEMQREQAAVTDEILFDAEAVEAEVVVTRPAEPQTVETVSSASMLTRTSNPDQFGNTDIFVLNAEFMSGASPEVKRDTVKEIMFQAGKDYVLVRFNSNGELGCAEVYDSNQECMTSDFDPILLNEKSHEALVSGGQMVKGEIYIMKRSSVEQTIKSAYGII